MCFELSIYVELIVSCADKNKLIGRTFRDVRRFTLAHAL